MGTNANGERTNGKTGEKPLPPAPNSTLRAPRRVVLLADGEDSPVEQVLVEYQGAEAHTAPLHEDVQRFAAAHRGQLVAAEWLGPLGWVRFLWCRR